ncbi:hypothetical protein MYCTH_2121095 [Thermothelomyces thermophilus ATCC 42464]|uniref:Guanylate kinase-like domain-containing protein n=1 Tax=Thermothelomyces thermophilus (strain ATCC 42464 / BCRC 31852 / DSM 1799) TaxID=573729 RepID=G2QMS0_THET4|nr:uncharacterized protein MYCTH_2121095 [Thermothelomyces thermophilus ATCC 42464]AEO61250.1 hypothetical protein MYCTH_2121095 [Thermothelomyces thermophilus ATCC 42464]
MTPHLALFPAKAPMAEGLHNRRPIVISGPSGVGKGTLCQRLLNAHPQIFAFSTEGSSYYFVSQDESESLIAEDAFIEHVEFNGNLSGTSKQTVIDQSANGSIVLLDINMEGVKQLKQEQWKADGQINPRFVFVKPPGPDVLEARLRGRGTEDEESIQKRGEVIWVENTK